MPYRPRAYAHYLLFSTGWPSTGRRRAFTPYRCPITYQHFRMPRSHWTISRSFKAWSRLGALQGACLIYPSHRLSPKFLQSNSHKKHPRRTKMHGIIFASRRMLVSGWPITSQLPFGHGFVGKLSKLGNNIHFMSYRIMLEILIIKKLKAIALRRRKMVEARVLAPTRPQLALIQDQRANCKFGCSICVRKRWPLGAAGPFCWSIGNGDCIKRLRFGICHQRA